MEEQEQIYLGLGLSGLEWASQGQNDGGTSWQDFVARCLISRGLLSNKLCSVEHRLNQGGPAHLLFWTFLTGMNVTHKAYNIFGKPIPEGSYILQIVDQCVEQN